jgi:hypothetical protein
MKTLAYVLAFSVSLFIVSVPITYAAEYMAPEVKVFNTDNKHLDKNFYAFDNTFKGGGSVATGDVDGDGNDEIIVGAGHGGGPQVRVFDNLGNFTGFSMFPFHPDFRGGVNVAAGDVNSDGEDEVIIVQASDGQVWVKAYKVDASKRIVTEFLAYEEGFEGGGTVAAGDIDGDGDDEIITGSGVNSTSHVRVFDGSGKYLGLSIFPFEENYRGGVNVAVGNVDGGAESEIIVSKASFGKPQIKVYKTDLSKRILGDFFAFAETHQEGVNIAACDIDRDSEDEVIVGSNGYGPHIRTFEAWGSPKTLSFMSYADDFRGGVNVACGNVDKSSATEIVTMPKRRVWEGRAGVYKYIEVSIGQQKLEAYKAGRKVNQTLVSTGVYDRPTPIGDFNIRTKLVSDDMEWEYGPDDPDNYDLDNVPYVMYFNGAYSLHGTYWHSNFGHRMSHGCVNLPTPFAQWLFGWANVGDRVYIRP